MQFILVRVYRIGRPPPILSKWASIWKRLCQIEALPDSGIVAKPPCEYNIVVGPFARIIVFVF